MPRRGCSAICSEGSMGPHSAREESGHGDLHREAKQAFSDALEQPPEERAEYLAHRFGAGSEIYREVISLLESYHSAASFFERPAADAVTTAPDPMIGRRVGVYRILRQIGMGGMGAVYLAERADDQFRKRV